MVLDARFGPLKLNVQFNKNKKNHTVLLECWSQNLYDLYIQYLKKLCDVWDDQFASCQCAPLISPGSRNLLWGGGGFTRGAAMYAKLFERGGGGGGGVQSQIRA